MIALGVELKKENVFITTVCPSGMPTTEAMKDAIKSQGAFGVWTACSADKVAKISLNANKKKKAIVVPKFINKTIMDATIIIVLVCLAACVAVYPKFEKRFGEME